MIEAPARGLLSRMRGAALLRAGAYEEAGRGAGTAAQAGLVALLASLASAAHDYGLGWTAMWWTAAAGLLHWPLLAAAAHLAGRAIPGADAPWTRLLRVLGFARAPGVLLVLTPLVGGIGLPVHAWMLAAAAAAIRQALGVGWAWAAPIALAGMAPYWIVLTLVLH